LASRIPSYLPERSECHRDPEAKLTTACLERAIERRSKVVVFGVEPVDLVSLSGAGQLGPCQCKGEVVLGMMPSDLVRFRLRPQSLRGVLANRLQHPVAPVRETNEAPVDQRLERVEIRSS
jgi:hypothetical protein